MGYDKTDDIKKGVNDEPAELSKRDGTGNRTDRRWEMSFAS
jgi:hypothetical protein